LHYLELTQAFNLKYQDYHICMSVIAVWLDDIINTYFYQYWILIGQATGKKFEVAFNRTVRSYVLHVYFQTRKNRYNIDLNPEKVSIVPHFFRTFEPWFHDTYVWKQNSTFPFRSFAGRECLEKFTFSRGSPGFDPSSSNSSRDV
jgi:hypothetical protein